MGKGNNGTEQPRPPYIACSACGEPHHIDVTIGEYQGQCFECGAFLRRPTEEEHNQFIEFMEWGIRNE